MRLLVVVRLDDAAHGAGPGTVIEVSGDPIGDVLKRHTDRDGARSERLRFWTGYEGVKVGDRVSLDA